MNPEGSEWSVAADGPTKLRYAKALGRELEQRVWPGSTLIYCPGKRYDGEVDPRWALRLITGTDGTPIVRWPQTSSTPQGPAARRALTANEAPGLLAAIGEGLGCPLQPLALRDPLDPGRQVWAAPLCHHDEASPSQPLGWQAAAWPLAEPLRGL
ncbi:MAG: transglutaminase family protein, partial [Cyanobium sp. LacPavin_0920_WC12_MAG_62_9]|nr:transglutaminase family protein [Cyanobium sp. LacPavin_0920_WC12_MAG_62_9]